MSTGSTTGQERYAASARIAAGELSKPNYGERGNRTSTTLSVIVPAYNEQYLVEASLSRLKILDESPLLQSIKIIVVDDGSSDGTPEAIERFRESLDLETHETKISWVFLRNRENGGKGTAIRNGLAQADTELVVIHDSDLEYHPSDLLKMVEVFLCEEADAVFGSRFMSGGYKRALFFRHSVGNKLLTFLCDLVCDLNLTDMETCYKMVRADLLKSIPLESSTFDIEPELAIKLAKRGARIFEVPISYSGRTYYEGKKINWKDGARALWAILYYAASSRIYVLDEHGGQILERLNSAPRFTRWMADVIQPYIGDRVLEIGAGTGNMSVHLMPRRAYWATDVNPHYLDYLVTLRPTRPYLSVAYTDAMEADSFPSTQSFDTVVCLNVVEHVQDDGVALRNIWKVLEHGGRAVILVPCGPGLYGTLDEVLGHLRRYTEEELGESCEGLRVPPGANVEIQPSWRSGLVAQWPDSEAKNVRTRPDSNAESFDSDFPSAGFMDSPSSAFAHCHTEEGMIQTARPRSCYVAIWIWWMRVYEPAAVRLS